ncbi:MAG: hypothetical protein ACTS73_01360 [Arsenophonus sp. NEOnobi-MAG3]
MGIFGKKAHDLSLTFYSISRLKLKKQWHEEYRQWCLSNLSDTRYVYFLANGI